MERKVIQYTDNPLLQVDDGFYGFDHMLRRADQRTVPLVLEYLYDKGMEVYLGGGVVSEWLLNGERGYTNIEILGVTKNERARLNLAGKFAGINQPMHYFELPKDFVMADLPSNNCERAAKSSILSIKGRIFDVVDVVPSIMRRDIQGKINERFKFFPERGWFTRPSILDVCLISEEKFSQKD